jgi:glycosyltransferase involved in cell wall biosynthesis
VINPEPSSRDAASDGAPGRTTDPAGPTIALAMIVRDEADVVERCIASVRPIITHWSVVDTGSTDGTPELVRQALDGLPGTLHERPWRNFGHNRTELMRLSRGVADYLLLVDADMTVRIEGPLPNLVADSYLLHHVGSLDYAVPRLVRGDLPWRFVGATHEYLALDAGDDDGEREAVLDELLIEHHADGGSRSDKFERDRVLLERALVDAPDDPRTLFYLAQTYAGLGEHDRAVELYRRRLAAGGWAEEAYCAQQQIGELLAMTDWDAAVPELLAAWQLRPERAEPLYHLARGYRSREQYHLAHHFASVGLTIPYPEHDRLFVQRDPYEWGLLFEYAIAAYWIGDPKAALEANEQLLADGVPSWVETWVRHNLGWCLQALGHHEVSVGGIALPPVGSVAPGAVADATFADLAPSRRLEPLDLDLGPTAPTATAADGSTVAWPRFNPSIAADGTGFRLITRASNYRLTDNGQYEPLEAGSHIRTINHVVRLDADLRVLDVLELPEVPDGPDPFPSLVRGCEDARPIEVDGRWYAVATVRDRNPAELCEMAWLSLDRTDDTPAGAPGATLRRLRPPHFDTTRHEKNWMPFVVDGELHILYACAPTVVLKVDAHTALVTAVLSSPAPAACEHLRGGSQGVEVDGRWYFATHEAAGHGSTRRYVHRVVRLRRDGERFVVDGVSPRFTFTGEPIEFCAGLAVSGDEALLSLGVGDARSLLARLPVAELTGLVDDA